MATSETQQILIDVQLKNQKIVADLNKVQKEINSIVKQEDMLRAASEKDVAALKKLDVALGVLYEREKYLTQELKSQQDAMATNDAAMKEMVQTSETLERIHAALSDEYSGASKKLDELRKALSLANSEEKKLIDSGQATDVELNKMHSIIIGLEKAIADVTKDTKNWVKELALAPPQINAVDNELKQLEQEAKKAGSSMKEVVNPMLLLDQALGSMRSAGRATMVVMDGLRAVLGGGVAGLAGVILSVAVPAIQKMVGHLDDAHEAAGDLGDVVFIAGKSFQILYDIAVKSQMIKKLQADMNNLINIKKKVADRQVEENHVQEIWNKALVQEGVQIKTNNGVHEVYRKGVKMTKDEIDKLNVSNRFLKTAIDGTISSIDHQIAGQKIDNQVNKEGQKIYEEIGERIKEVDALRKTHNNNRKNHNKEHKLDLKELHLEEKEYLQDLDMELSKEEQLTIQRMEKNKEGIDAIKAYLKKRKEMREAEYKEMLKMIREEGVEFTSEELHQLKHSMKLEEGEWEKFVGTIAEKLTEKEKILKEQREKEQKELEESEKEQMRQTYEFYAWQQKEFEKQQEEELEKRKKWHEKQIEIDKAFAMQSIDTFKGMFDAIHTSITNSNNEHLTNLENQYKLGLMTAASYEEQRIRITEEGNKKARKLAITAALAERTKASFTVVLESMKSIAELVAMEPLTMGMPQAALVKAMMAMQLATIWAQPLPTAKKGGEVGGNKHEDGGTVIEAERGEYIVSASAYEGNKGIVQAINSGASFQTMMSQYQDKMDGLLDAIKGINVIATISSIEKAQSDYNYMKYNQ